LEELVRAIQGDIYGLALRMLCNREDAEDATQEILVRIVTRLSQFDFCSKLKTWASRVAVNYILDVTKSATERLHLSFERFAENLTSGLDVEAPAETERSLLIEEVKVGCTIAIRAASFAETRARPSVGRGAMGARGASQHSPASFAGRFRQAVDRHAGRPARSACGITANHLFAGASRTNSGKAGLPARPSGPVAAPLSNLCVHSVLLRVVQRTVTSLKTNGDT